MKAERTDHLGYDKGDKQEEFIPDSRNGSCPKILFIIAEDVDLNVASDRAGTPRQLISPTTARARRKE
ncbi:transposase [Glutamicibacter ardleyensis]|uniref:transposase n=1 Tax=Glutamicibacter ardleyensis TaxID=225894 RepID=UPI0038995B32